MANDLLLQRTFHRAEAGGGQTNTSTGDNRVGISFAVCDRSCFGKRHVSSSRKANKSNCCWHTGRLDRSNPITDQLANSKQDHIEMGPNDAWSLLKAPIPGPSPAAGEGSERSRSDRFHAVRSIRWSHRRGRQSLRDRRRLPSPEAGEGLGMGALAKTQPSAHPPTVW